IYTARNIKADEAYRIGLVNAVYPQEELMDAAKKLAAGIAKNAPIAVRACKKAINDGLDAVMDDAIVIEEKLFGSCFETEDQKAGMGNFLEKDKEKKLKVVPFAEQIIIRRKKKMKVELLVQALWARALQRLSHR
ncbi:MAG: enoyl-CoA hydratase-related protein, partial [Eubacterium ventriosum]